MASDHTTAASGAATLGPLNDRAIKDAIRNAYDLGYNDARTARTVPGDSAPGYKGRDAERDHGGALIHTLSRSLAAPAAQEAEPPTSGNPPDCDPELYAHGVSVGLFDLPKWTAEALCRGVSAATGARVDWHYVGGRVHVKALPALPAPRPQADAGAVPEGAEQVGEDGWPKLVKPARCVAGLFARGVSARLLVESCYRRAEIEATAPAAYAPPECWRDEVQRLSQFATTAMYMSERDKRNCLDDIAQRLANMLHEDAAPAPAAGAAPQAPSRTMHITEHHGTVLPDGRVLGAWSRSYDAPMPEPDAPDAPRLIGVDMAAGPDAAHWTAEPAPFQQRVQPWLIACFGATIAGDREERNHRFLEEALELVQSCGCSASEAHQLVDYVFGRPVGEPAQEVGGVMVTLAALCLANGLDMHAAGETELARIWTKVEAIRAKQAAKPKHSPLPEHAPSPAPAQEADAGWMPIETAPDGERVLLGPRHAPVVGTVRRPAFREEEQEPTTTVVHYNGTTLVAGYRCSEWHRLPGAARAQEAIPLTQAARDVLAERRRQVEAEGWTPEHDDEHADRALSMAAVCYVLGRTSLRALDWSPDIMLWPWDRAWWKPRDDRSNYVRAAALLLAELERHDRAAARARQEGQA